MNIVVYFLKLYWIRIEAEHAAEGNTLKLRAR